ncbi:MAG: HAD family hydrolase [Planctomycetes bacterium]|nr:HAD family hydrolase [Planctomycetota bacterium]
MSAGQVLHPAVFLDRDGTLTVESEWVRSGQDLVLVPGAAEAILHLARAGFAVVLVTNQSAVARGIVTEAELAGIHAHFAALLAERGARLDAVYHCPHHPTEGVGAWKIECACRKPAPGMLLDAARDLGLDLARSWIVGDALRDLEAGWSAGARAVLVATGKGTREHAAALAKGRAPDAFVPDVLAAARWIVEHTQGR